MAKSANDVTITCAQIGAVEGWVVFFQIEVCKVPQGLFFKSKGLYEPIQ